MNSIQTTQINNNHTEIYTPVTTTITTTSTSTIPIHLAVGISLGALFLILLLLLPVIGFYCYKRRKFKHTFNIHLSDTVRTERLYEEVTPHENTDETHYSIIHSIGRPSMSDETYRMYDIITNESPESHSTTENCQLSPSDDKDESTTSQSYKVYDMITSMQIPNHSQLSHSDTTQHSTSYVNISELEVPYDTLQYTMKNRTSQEDTHTPVDTQGVYDKINIPQATPQALYSTPDVPNTIQHRIVNGCKYTVVTKKRTCKPCEKESVPNGTTEEVNEHMTENMAESTTEGIPTGKPIHKVCNTENDKLSMDLNAMGNSKTLSKETDLSVYAGEERPNED